MQGTRSRRGSWRRDGMSGSPTKPGDFSEQTGKLRHLEWLIELHAARQLLPVARSQAGETTRRCSVQHDLRAERAVQNRGSEWAHSDGQADIASRISPVQMTGGPTQATSIHYPRRLSYASGTLWLDAAKKRRSVMRSARVEWGIFQLEAGDFTESRRMVELRKAGTWASGSKMWAMWQW